MSPSHLDLDLDLAQNVESIERATVAAVAPDAVTEIPGWLLPFDGGTVGRAHSAVPLRHDASILAADVAAIVIRYRERGLAPSLRVADVPALAHLAPALAAAGLVRTQPTLTCVARVADILSRFGPHGGDAGGGGGAASVAVLPAPDAAWSQVYLGEGFDPVDGAHRVRALSRAAGSLYACSSANGAGHVASGVVATGVGSLGHGLLGIHGMRTLPGHRRQGHASRILRALAQRAQARGVAGAYLQVEEGNAPALRLYASLGFSVAWRYIYWRAGAKQ